MSLMFSLLGYATGLQPLSVAYECFVGWDTEAGLPYVLRQYHCVG